MQICVQPFQIAGFDSKIGNDHSNGKITHRKNVNFCYILFQMNIFSQVS